MEDLPDLSPAGRERIARFKSRKESILSILQTPKVVKKKQGRKLGKIARDDPDCNMVQMRDSPLKCIIIGLDQLY